MPYWKLLCGSLPDAEYLRGKFWESHGHKKMFCAVQSSHGEDTKYYEIWDRRRSPPRYERSILERLHRVSFFSDIFTVLLHTLRSGVADDRLC